MCLRNSGCCLYRVNPTENNRLVFKMYLDCRKLCGTHRIFEDEQNEVKVHELIHTEHGDIADESGDQPCEDDEGNTQWPGNSWLSQDSCNICTCPGRTITTNLLSYWRGIRLLSNQISP